MMQGPNSLMLVFGKNVNVLSVGLDIPLGEPRPVKSILANKRFGKLSRGYLLSKQEIELGKRPVLGFWESEVRPNDAQDSRSRPKVTRLGFPIPSGRRLHIRVDGSDDYPVDDIDESTESDRPSSETRSWDLTYYSVTDGSDGHVKCQIDNDHESPDCFGGGRGVVDSTEDSDDDVGKYRGDDPPDIDRSTICISQENPGAG